MNKSNWDLYWGDEKKLEYWQKPARSIIELIVKCDPNIQKKILDLGCGIGRHAIAFAQNGFDVTAVDSSKQALKELNKLKEKHGLNITTIIGNYLKPIFNKKSFDIIISYNVIYHGCREDFKNAVELCERYLKPKGILFFTCPSRNDGKYGNGDKVAPNTYKSLNSVHPGDIHYFSNKKDIFDVTGDLKLINLKKNEYFWDNNGEKQLSSYWEVLLKKE